MPYELWMEVHDTVQETGIKTIPKEKKCKKKKKKVYSLKNIQILKNITDRSNKIKGDKGRSDK